MITDAGENLPAPATAMRRDDGSDNPAALVGRSIAGKFVIESLIASGGAGSVYRARQLALDRVVALKVLRQDVARDAHFAERFRREARAASRLDHPNSVRVFDFGSVDGSLLYLAMEFVEGRTLHQVISEEWPLGEERIVDLMSQVLSAVGVAHEMGVIHRDLKPDNIMIIRATGDEGEAMEIAKVCDFGIAMLGAATHDGAGGMVAGPWATMDGSLVGTPGYMSPEQARGEPADRRSDIYSAGVILYHMLVGRPPFDGDSAYLVAMKHITDSPLPPSEITAVDPALEAVCLRAMSKAPDDRFGSAREMRASLRAVIARATSAKGRSASADVTPPPRVQSFNTQEVMEGAGSGPAAHRRRRVAAVLGAAALVAVAGAFAAKSRFRAAPVPAPPASAAAAVTPPAGPSPQPSPEDGRGGTLPSAVEATPRAAEPRRSAGAAPAQPTERRARPRKERDRGLVPAAAMEAKRETAGATAIAPPTVAPAVAPPTAPRAAAAPAPVAAAPAKAPAARIDVERAAASITAVTTTSAIPGSNIRAAVGRIPLARCYRDALRAGGLASGTATLRLRIDIGGYVTGAALQGAGITPMLKGCIEKAATAIRIKDVDTGDATADVTLSFVAAP
jgi:serine/threonine-protein kinase